MKKVFETLGTFALMTVAYIILLLLIIFGSPYWAWCVVSDDSEHGMAREW